MNEGNSIRHIKRQEIEVDKWDRCIQQASNGLIYGYSFYLDHMAEYWDALVLGDYQAVMPLTWNRKYGISYLYQPFLTPQLGVFGEDITDELVEDFVQAIPQQFRLIEIFLHQGALLKNWPGVMALRTNYTLSLRASYQQLYAGFRENTQRNIKRASQSALTVSKNIELDQIIALTTLQMKRDGEKAGTGMDRFRKLYTYLQAKKMTATYGILSPRGELLASAVFFFSHHRAWYILVGNHPNGKTLGASHALVHAFIKDYAGQNILLDFEGSDIQNLAFFYSGFGATATKYLELQLNRLPFYLRWLKQ